MNTNQKEMSTLRALMWMGVILEAVLLASLTPGDAVGGNVEGTVVLMFLLGIPVAILAWITRGESTG